MQANNERTHEHHEQSASSAGLPRASCLSVSRPRIPYGNTSGPHSPITVVHEGLRERKREKQRAK